MMEGDQVEVVPGATTTDRYRLLRPSSQTVNIAGTVHKVNLHTLFPRIPVDQDLCVPGTSTMRDIIHMREIDFGYPTPELRARS